MQPHDVDLAFDETFRVSQLALARTFAARAKVACTLCDDATLDEIRAFVSERAQPVFDREAAKADEATRRCFGGRLTAPSRRRLHEEIPGFHEVSSDHLLKASSLGLRGDRAVRYALRVKRRTARPSPRGSSSPPRRRRASTNGASRIRGPDDGVARPRISGELRQELRHLRSEAVASRVASTTTCQGCLLDLPSEAFRAGRRTCTDCEIGARLARRAASRLAA